jgi:exodeoxyribonuclease VII large subunit
MLAGLARGLPHPRRSLDLAIQRLDDWSERLRAVLPALLVRKGQQLAVTSAKLQPRSLAQSIARHEADVTQMAERAKRVTDRMLHDRGQKLGHLVQLLESLNYKRVLERGFALVKSADGKLVTRAATIAPGESLELTFRDGTRGAKAV